jgi:hypothetical protein
MESAAVENIGGRKAAVHLIHVLDFREQVFRDERARAAQQRCDCRGPNIGEVFTRSALQQQVEVHLHLLADAHGAEHQ